MSTGEEQVQGQPVKPKENILGLLPKMFTGLPEITKQGEKVKGPAEFSKSLVQLIQFKVQNQSSHKVVNLFYFSTREDTPHPMPKESTQKAQVSSQNFTTLGVMALPSNRN